MDHDPQRPDEKGPDRPEPGRPVQERSRDEEAVVEGRLERIIFESTESGFVVARLEPDEGRGLTITGLLAGLMPGERIRARGEWVNHPRFGRQLKVRAAEPVGPPNLEGVRRYLEGGAVSGVGPVIAQRLVEAFGEDLPRILGEEPEKLLTIEGLGAKRANQIVEGWTKRQESRDTFIFLQGHGLGPGQASRVFRTYGADATRAIRENPYRLVDEVTGIGFRTADRIARAIGFDPDGDERLSAGIVYVLQSATAEGHIYLPFELLSQRAAACLSVEEDQLNGVLERMADAGRVIRETLPNGEDAVYHPELRARECALAGRLVDLRDARHGVSVPDIPRAIARAQRRVGLELTDTQTRAIAEALRSKVSIITGGPGVGKTTIIRILVTILGRQNVKMALAAPTGRAAKRLALASGVAASTLHRLLRFDPQTGLFEHGSFKPLPHRFVIVDEVSMCDLPLTHALVDALRDETHLLLAGDADQLPSVGPGNVLRDLITSGSFAVTRLDTVFRQSERSPIVHAAHQILAGRLPSFRVEQGEGIAFIEEDDPVRLQELIVDLAARRIPRRLNCSPDQIQVLSPMIRGPAGVASLNRAMQSRLNPAHGEEPAPDGAHPENRKRTREERPVIREGDRVMQIRNNYETNVFNGDVGRVVLVSGSPPELTVRFEDKTVVYTEANFEQLLLSYAITVHRSQGCEFPVVIVPLTTQHRLLLRRNIIYTAVTRARTLVVLAGMRRAIGIAVRDDRMAARYTGLAQRLGRITQEERCRTQIADEEKWADFDAAGEEPWTNGDKTDPF